MSANIIQFSLNKVNMLYDWLIIRETVGYRVSSDELQSLIEPLRTIL